MSTGVRSKYNIALGGKGFILRGTPSSPQYKKELAPTVINQLGVGNLDYNQLNGSGWRYWPQTDWSGGFQQLKYKDNATFKTSQGVDTIKKYGQINLQNNFTSAATISGSHSYGSHGIHGSELLFGTIKSGAAKIFKLNSSNSLSPVSAMAGISAVNSMTRFNDNTIVGMTRTSGTLKTMSQYNGSALSGFRNANPIVRSVKGIGIRLYSGEKVASLSGDVVYYSEDLSTFTSAYQVGKNRNVDYIEDLQGYPYFFISEGNKVEMMRWDEFAERAYSIHTWSNLTNYTVKNYLSLIIITGTSNGKSVAFAFNGARLFQIFDDQLQDNSLDFSRSFIFDDVFHTGGAKWDGKFWFPGIQKLNEKSFENFNNKVYSYRTTGSNLILSYLDSTKYQTSGHLISSEFGHDLGGVDKLVNCVDINTEALATGESVEIFKSVDGGSSFTSVGTMNEISSVHKTLYYPSGFVSKLWSYKAKLVGPGTSTPTVLDITHQYRPMPDVKKKFSLTIDASDEIKLLNGQKEERDGREIMSELWVKKDQKSTLVYEDIDAFSVNIVSAMTSSATSTVVSDTRLMPAKGRMRVLKSGAIEEMSYTSANGNTIKGITRGVKNTKARAYTSADVIDNYYNVVIVDMVEHVNNTDQEKTESIASVILLEV